MEAAYSSSGCRSAPKGIRLPEELQRLGDHALWSGLHPGPPTSHLSSGAWKGSELVGNNLCLQDGRNGLAEPSLGISQLALYYQEGCCKRSSRSATEEPLAHVLSSQLSQLSFFSVRSSPSCLTRGELKCSMTACHLLPQSTHDGIKGLGKPSKLSLICQQFEATS